jgi:hypothetical protein
MCWKWTHVPTILGALKCAWTRPVNNWWPTPASPSQRPQGSRRANLFMVCEPLTGHRQVKVTARRTAVAFASVIQELVDVQ